MSATNNRLYSIFIRVCVFVVVLFVLLQIFSRYCVDTCTSTLSSHFSKSLKSSVNINERGDSGVTGEYIVEDGSSNEITEDFEEQEEEEEEYEVPEGGFVDQYKKEFKKCERVKDIEIEELPSLTFWVSDLHDGTTADVYSLLTYLGQTVINARSKGRNNPHPQIWTPNIVDVERMSPDLVNLGSNCNDYLSEAYVRNIFEFYKDDEQLAEVDAFVCMFLPGFCEMFIPFNKSLIFLAAHRYAHGHCTNPEKDRLNEHLRLFQTRNPARPYSVVGAMNIYDVEYGYYFSGLNFDFLEGTALFYATSGLPLVYDQRREEILVAPINWKIGNEHYEVVRPHLDAIDGYTFNLVRSLYPRFTFEQLKQHRAAIIFPYAVFSYWTTDLYAIGIPLFCPSIEFMLELDIGFYDRMLDWWPYCPDHDLKPHISATGMLSPEVKQRKDMKYWLQFADVYRWENVVIFDSWDDLKQKLDDSDFDNIKVKMAEENCRRRTEVVNKWKKIIRNIQKGRVVPKEYEDSLQKMYGRNRVQVRD